MIGILILVAAVILHLSLYPWRFAALPPEADPLALFLRSWPRFITRRAVVDVAANVALYVPLGVSAWLALAGVRRRWTRAAAVVALGAALSLGVEFAQLYNPRRMCNLLDSVSNTVGTAAGVLIGALAGAPAEGRRRLRLLPSAGGGLLVLLCCWTLYQIYPLVAETNRYILLVKLRQALSASPFSLTALFVCAAEFAALGVLLRNAWSARPAAVLFVLFALLVPARLAVSGRSLGLDELAALPLAAAALMFFPADHARRALAAAVLICAALAVYGLAPFRMAQEPAAFEWMPFQAMIEGDRRLMLPLILRKAFRYGTLVWLLRSSSLGYPIAAALAAAWITLIEVAQIYAAGHVAELTDPLLAIMLALVLAALERVSRAPTRRAAPPEAIAARSGDR